VFYGFVLRASLALVGAVLQVAAATSTEVNSVTRYSGDGWDLVNGDCVQVMAEQPANSVDLSVYSPPFMSLYTYTASEHDMGNCSSRDEFFAHLAFMIRGCLRLTKPGRLTCCHVAQVPAMLSRDGFIGMKDFRGETIAAYQAEGWIYHGEVCIDKCPQAQAIRTKSKSLLFIQLRKDASWLRPALADYILVFRKPGDNPVPILPDLSNEEWIQWARPIWYGISESDTLQVAEAREDEDERHICPLQLGTIERCVRLWSNPGELVLSPFAGIGSEGYEAIRLGRRFLGVELKPSYAAVAVKNLQAAVAARTQGTLFSEASA
jgi:DNA modification methylase